MNINENQLQEVLNMEIRKHLFLPPGASDISRENTERAISEFILGVIQNLTKLHPQTPTHKPIQ